MYRQRSKAIFLFIYNIIQCSQTFQAKWVPIFDFFVPFFYCVDKGICMNRRFLCILLRLPLEEKVWQKSVKITNIHANTWDTNRRLLRNIVENNLFNEHNAERYFSMNMFVCVVHIDNKSMEHAPRCKTEAKILLIESVSVYHWKNRSIPNA